MQEWPLMYICQGRTLPGNLRNCSNKIESRVGCSSVGVCSSEDKHWIKLTLLEANLSSLSHHLCVWPNCFQEQKSSCAYKTSVLRRGVFGVCMFWSPYFFVFLAFFSCCCCRSISQITCHIQLQCWLKSHLLAARHAQLNPLTLLFTIHHWPGALE